MLIALTIAGSDSGGGAGLQADLKTFHRFGVFGTSAVTAITAQNTLAVSAWTPVSAELVAAQIDAVATDLRPQAVKSGMLASREIVRAVAAALRRHALAPFVLDPVLAASTGRALSDRDTATAIAAELVPQATLVTPNLDEAEHLTRRVVRDVSAMTDAARALVAAGARAALVTGGHLEGDELSDVLVDGQQVHVFRYARIATTSTHGTGCTLSAAITAQLALGASLLDAVEHARAFVQAAIATAPRLGAGRGPLNLFADP